MKNRNSAFLGVLPMAILMACNLAAPGESATIAWDTMRLTPPAETPAALVPHGATPTQPSATPTVSPTPTANPLAIPRLDSGSAIDILRVDMLDAAAGWGIGGPLGSGNAGHVFRTSDGGKTWAEVTPPETTASPAEVERMAAIGFFADAQTGWVTYHASIPSGVPQIPVVVWKTVDGGGTWLASSPLATDNLTETFSVSHILFAGNTGWVLAHVGAGMNHDYVALYRSIDGGSSWTRLIDPVNDGGIQSCTKTGLAFADGLNGWLAGNCNGVRPGAFLFSTSSGGVNWEAVELPAPADPPDLFTADQYACGVHAPFFVGSRAFAGVECADMGNPGSANLSFLYRNDAGLSPRPYPGGDLFVLNDRVIWALGKEIYRTLDGGESWTKMSAVTWDGRFDFIDANAGWAAVSKGNEYGLVQTADGGATWAQLTPEVAAPG